MAKEKEIIPEGILPGGGLLPEFFPVSEEESYRVPSYSQPGIPWEQMYKGPPVAPPKTSLIGGLAPSQPPGDPRTLSERLPKPELAPNSTLLEKGLWAAQAYPQAAGEAVTGLARGVQGFQPFDPPSNDYVMMPDGTKKYATPDSRLAAQDKSSQQANVPEGFGTGQYLDPNAYPEDVDAGISAGQQLAGDAANLGTSFEDEAMTLVRKIGAERAAQQGILDELQVNGMGSIQESMDRMKAAYTKIDLDMAKLKVDPNRWEKETPAFTQALLMIGAGAFGFITQGRGPNPILGILDRAIQKDVDAQMVNYDLAMKRAGMQFQATRTQELARQKLQTAMWSRAVHALNAMTENSKTEMAALQFAAMLRDAQQRTALEWEKTYLAGRKSMMPQGKWDDAITGRTVTQGSTGVQGISDLWDQYKKARGGSGSLAGKASDIAGGIAEATGLGTTQMHEYSRQAKAKVLDLAAQKNGGRPTDKDFAAVEGLLPTAGISQEAAGGRIVKLMNEYIDDLTANFNSLSPADKYKAHQAYQRSLADAVGFFKKNPDLIKYSSGSLKSLLEMR